MVILQQIRLIAVGFLILVSAGISAQTLSIEMDKDTISMEEIIMVKYIIDDNCNARELEFENFLVVSGPSVTRNVSIINGKRTAESSFTVMLTAIEEGTFSLPQTLCGATLAQPVKITVKVGYQSKETKDEKIRTTRKIKKI